MSGLSAREIKSIQVLVVDDEEPFRKLLVNRLSDKGYRVWGAETGEAALDLAGKEDFHVGILDIRMPGISGIELLQRLKEWQPSLEAIMLTGQGSVDSAVEAMKLGAYDYLTKPCKLNELEIIVQKAYQKQQISRQNVILKKELEKRAGECRIIGRSKGIIGVLEMVKKVSQSDAPVMISGESGTGKELVAHAIHRGSRRSQEPFVVINCAALNDNLLENELFGHEKGAFTGATGMKHGLFEVAHRGTLFIDEIGEMSPSFQAKLLRVVETGRFQRVGGLREVETDVRIISATHRDLEEEMKAGRFRDDLFYRLNVVTVQLPLLAERREDIPLLAEHFLDVATAKTGAAKKLSPEAMDVLLNYHWPGNIRELANVIERAFVISAGDLIGPADLHVRTQSPPSPDSDRNLTLEELERKHIARVLEEEEGNKSRTARRLGISLRNLYRKIERYGITV